MEKTMSLYDIARACYYDPNYVWEHYGKPIAFASFMLVSAAFVVAVV
jgi:hypothetical protein